MSLRWRRSLPTENARSPAPVRTTTRTAGRTAIASTTSVSRAPISVVIALSACGRFSVTTAIRPPDEVVEEHRGVGLLERRPAGDRSRATPSGRCRCAGRGHVVLFSAGGSPVSRSASQRRARRPGAKQYSPPRVTTKGGTSGSRRRIGVAGDGEGPRAVVRPDQRVLLGRGADEDAVVEPLGLDELELAPQVRAGEDEDDAPVGAVVLEDALGQHRPVARAPPDHAVQAHVDAALVVERVPRVGPAGVRAGRALEAAQVVGVAEVVVAGRVGAELGVVPVRGRPPAGRRSASARPSWRRASASSSRLAAFARRYCR